MGLGEVLKVCKLHVWCGRENILFTDNFANVEGNLIYLRNEKDMDMICTFPSFALLFFLFINVNKISKTYLETFI